MKLLVLYLLIFVQLLYAQGTQEIDFSQLNSQLVDQINLLESKEEKKLLSQIKALEVLSDSTIQLIAFKNPNKINISELEKATLEKLNLPEKAKENLILILISIQTREIQVKLGSNIQTFISNKEIQTIISNELVPNFKSNQFFIGINKLLNQIKLNFIKKNDKQISAKTKFYFLKVKPLIKDPNYYLPLLIFLSSFFILLKLLRGPQILRPIFSALYFGLLTYNFNKSIEYTGLSIIIGFSIGMLSPLNSILYFLSNRKRGHQQKGNKFKSDFIWFKNNHEHKFHGIQGSIE